MYLLLFHFLLKLNEAYISFTPKWTKAHAEWVQTLCLLLYPYCSQPNKSKLRCHLTLN